MVIEVRLMQYALAAYEHGSFRQAAESMRLKQPTLSRRIRQLEDILGVQLFLRSTAGVVPTDAGRDFLRIAGRIIEEINTMMSLAKAGSRGETGRLRVGFYTSLSAGNLRALLLDFAAKFPDVAVYPVEGCRTHLFTELEGGTLDAVIVSGELEVAHTQSLPLWSERIMVALPEAHRLTAHDIVYWTDLKHERFLLSRRDPGPEIQDMLISKLAAPGDRPDVVVHDVSRENILSMVAAGLGVSLLCESSTGVGYAGLVYREAREGNGPSRIGQSAYWRPENKNPALLPFVRLLKERYPLRSV